MKVYLKLVFYKIPLKNFSREFHPKNYDVKIYEDQFQNFAKNNQLCTGTLWQKFHNLCIFLPRHDKIVRKQKKLMRYENMVFFTVTRSFYY